MFNKAIIEGHLGSKPELKTTTTNGVPVCNLSVCTNESWTDKTTGQKMEKKEWHNVVCFKGLAETVAAHMDKGRQVLVEGRLQTREYMGKATNADGSPIMLSTGQQLMVRKFTTEIVANNVQFLGKNPNSRAYPAGTAVQAVGAVAPAASIVAPAAAPVFIVAPPAQSAVAPVVDANPQTVAGTFVQPIASIPGV